MPYKPLEKLSQLYDGYKKSFRLDSQNLLLIQEEGKLYLIENRCPHMDVPLETGTIEVGQHIRCRAHGIAFDLNTGQALGPLADTLACLKRFSLVYEGTTVGIDLP